MQNLAKGVSRNRDIDIRPLTNLNIASSIKNIEEERATTSLLMGDEEILPANTVTKSTKRPELLIDM